MTQWEELAGHRGCLVEWTLWSDDASAKVEVKRRASRKFCLPLTSGGTSTAPFAPSMVAGAAMFGIGWKLALVWLLRRATKLSGQRINRQRWELEHPMDVQAASDALGSQMDL